MTLTTRVRTAAAGALRVTETRSSPSTRLPWHAHEHACLVVALDGAFAEVFHDRTITCDGPTALFKPAGERHANEYGRHGARCLIVELPGPWLARLSLRADALSRVASVRHPMVTDLAIRMQGEMQRPDLFSSLIGEGLVLDLLGLALRHGSADGRVFGLRWLRHVRDRLHNDFLSKLTVAELATEAGVHADHLGRCFRRQYGTTIGEYVRHLRLRWAAHAIATTSMSLAEIALAAGFADQSALTRRFRGAFGTTPGRYRSSLRS